MYNSELVRTYIYTNDVIIYLIMWNRKLQQLKILKRTKRHRVMGMGWTGTEAEAGEKVGQWIRMCRVYGFQISLRASPVSWLKLECLFMSRASLIFLVQNLSSIATISLWSKSMWWFSPMACSAMTDLAEIRYKTERTQTTLLLQQDKSTCPPIP